MPRIVHVISTAEKVLASLLAAGAEAGWDQVVLNPFGTTADSLLARAAVTSRRIGR